VAEGDLQQIAIECRARVQEFQRSNRVAVSMITSEAMLDPAVSLCMLRLDNQLALAGSDEAKVTSVRESFEASIAGMAPRFWFVALGRNLLAAAAETNATRKQRQAAVDQLRRLTNQLPDSAELHQQFTEALQKLSSQ
jgi:ABC-type transporter Mla subunit MlaD